MIQRSGNGHRQSTRRAASHNGVRSCAESAKAAGLHYATDISTGIRRLRCGSGFTYRHATGRPVRDAATLKRIRSLVLPPAWRDVRVARDPLAHLQAVGRDAAGRLQYRYHPTWAGVRDSTKYHRMLDFAKALPGIRRRTDRDWRGPARSRARVLATVVKLLERTHLRIGNEEYARTNGSHGLTTLRDRHVEISGRHLHFKFRAKSGVYQTLDLDDARLARAVRECQDLPGQILFQYVDEAGEIKSVSSSDVNEYLRASVGGTFTAKDFRTWAGTVAAARALDELGTATTKSARAGAILKAIDQVAQELGNTRAVCRRCYIHPGVFDAYLAGFTIGRFVDSQSRCRGLLQAEGRLVALLRASARR
jgi:DNA topoisomerase-1